MSDSDSDSDCSCPEEFYLFDLPRPVYLQGLGFPQEYCNLANLADHSYNPLDEAVNRWSAIAPTTQRTAFMRMKMVTFWLPILLKPDKSSVTFTWAVKVGLLSSQKELNIKHLIKIEAVEEILKTMEKGIFSDNQAKHVVFLSCMFYLQTQPITQPLVDAMRWFEAIGGGSICSRVLDLGHERPTFTALQFIFVEVSKHIKNMGVQLEKTMTELMSETPSSDVQKSDEMKKKGNDHFQEQQYEPAIKFYSKAIEFNPENHIFFGNRAQCYIRCKKYINAVFDGKCAILIKPEWAKGHYRFAEALFYMGELERAFKANETAINMCSNDDQMVLQEQRMKFIEEVTKPNSSVAKLGNVKHYKMNNSRPQSAKATGAISTDKNSAPKNKVPRNTTGKKTGEVDKTTPAEGSTKDTNSSKSQVSPGEVRGETPDAGGKKKVSHRKVEDNPQKVKNHQKVEDSPKKVKKNPQPVKENLPQPQPVKENLPQPQQVRENLPQPQQVQENPLQPQRVEDNCQKVEDKAKKKKKLNTIDRDNLCRKLSCLVQDAHTALADLRSHNAEQAFSRALDLLETGTPKDLGLSSLDVMLLLFGRVLALIEIGQPEELGKAEKVVDKIMSFKERTFECLVIYARGKIFLQENRFSEAKQQFLFSLQILNNKILPGKLTWPLTKEIVKETHPEYFKDVLEQCIETCKFPPPPVAICRLDQSPDHQKAQIYYSDKDFKGFVQIRCCQNCVVDYHSVCWKTLKTSSFSEKNDKDFLQESCLTPDCRGKIWSIKIFDPTGLLKFKVEAAITKPQTPKKPKVNQKCISLKTIKAKEERRLKTKQQKLSFKANQLAESENLQQAEDSAGQTRKASQRYRDPVLLQLSQNVELLREEQNLQVSTLADSLRPWLTLDQQRGNQLAGRLLRWEEERLETVYQVTEVVLERKNRIWARVVVQLLGKSQTINPKLSKWAQRLDDAGLTAAKRFVELHSTLLEQLNLSSVLHFGPLREVVLDKLGMTPDSFPNADVTLTDFLKQAMADDVRLFIWALEEHREDFAPCHSLLDYYFDMMDVQYLILKKESEYDNNYMKGQGHKKKHKDAWLPRSTFVLSNVMAQTQREEPDFYEDQSLCFLNPDEPFRVPSQLREQVAEFESEYILGSDQQFDNVDLAKTSLYDYFAQILEQRGPLNPEDPLLVGELHNFPVEAQLKIQEAGGIEPFLLESVRFRKLGMSIALMPAASVQRTGGGANLPDFNIPDYSSYACSSQLVLPNPHLPGSSGETPQSHSALCVDVPAVVDDDEGLLDFSQVEDPYSSFNKEEELNVDQAKRDGETLSGNGDSACGLAAVEDNVRSVAVNTELHSPFEVLPGDINEKQKSNTRIEKKIEDLVLNCGVNNVDHKEKLAVLQQETQTIKDNIQVTNQELLLFRKKLEEEVKKDQKEKKANQEALKSIKLELEAMAEKKANLSQTIQENKSEYDGLLSDFLELSNLSASEKSSIEDDIRRYKAVKTLTSRRSHTAQLSMAESSRTRDLQGLGKDLTNAKTLLGHLDRILNKYSNERLEDSRDSLRAEIGDIEREISIRESAHRQLIEQVKSGARVSELPLVEVDYQPEGATAPLELAEGGAAASTCTREPSYYVLNKATKRLSSLFPDCSRGQLKRLIQEFRSSRGGTLSGFSIENLVSGVSNLILNSQERSSSRSNMVASDPQSVTPPPVPSAWQTPQPKKDPTSIALNAEDPCIICHEDMNPDHICVLQCRHSFHDWCIRQWLKENNTCPNCRVKTLLPDFPLLTSRRRQGP